MSEIVVQKFGGTSVGTVDRIDSVAEIIKKASKRVLVKRHNKSKYLEDKKPNYSITGKVIRYDVYHSS